MRPSIAMESNTDTNSYTIMCAVPSDASTDVDVRCPIRSRSAMLFPEPDEAVTGHTDMHVMTRSRSAMLDEDDIVEVPVGRMRSAMLPDTEDVQDALPKRSSSKGSFIIASVLNPLLKGLRLC
mmetsp:Transcript_28731/g.52346  ORF Transcript_28731/g.52346 Transcript_28731/m.52346 type:complete len:123 (+) Transcript_28731:85-453(+)